MGAARRFARERGETGGWSWVGEFDRCDSYCAARNYADSLATGDWLLWMDADDSFVNGDALVRRLAVATESMRLLALSWEYKTLSGGETVVHWSERVMRAAGAPKWEDRLHPYRLVPRAAVRRIPPHVCHVVHRGDPDTPGKRARNLGVAQRWLADEPEQLRAMSHTINELAHQRQREATLGL